MARTPTLPPDHPGMWRRLVARAHPDAGGDHELFIWTGALRDVVCSLSLHDTPKAEGHPSTEDPARIPYPPGADFAALTGRALVHAGEFAHVLALLRDCWPAEDLVQEILQRAKEARGDALPAA